MNQNTKISTKRIAMAGMLAALTFVGSGLRIKIPVDIGGTTAFHLGNIMCALSGILLGPWLGGTAAGLGSAIYDMTDPSYISECWLTFLMKFAYGMAAGLAIRAGKKDWGYGKAALATLAGAVTYAILYLVKSFLKTMIVSGVTADAALLAAGMKLPATIFNAAVAVIFAPVLAVAIRKALKQNHITLS